MMPTKRGISPIITVVMLLLLVTISASAFMTFFQQQIKQQQQQISKQSARVQYDFWNLKFGKVYLYDYRKNLVLDMPFDYDFNDYSGQNNNGQCSSNCPTLGSGLIGKALYNDGTKNYITVPDRDYFDIYDGTNVHNITIVAYIYAKQLGGGTGSRVVIQKGDSSNGWEWILWSYNSDYAALSFSVYNSTGSSAGVINVGVTQFSPNKWYFVAGVIDGANAKIYLYLNNKLMGSNNINTTGLTVNGQSPVQVADGEGTGHDPWNGSIDELRIYKEALPEDVIRNLFFRLQIQVYNPSGEPIGFKDAYYEIDDFQTGEIICQIPMIYGVTYITQNGKPYILPGKEDTLKLALNYGDNFCKINRYHRYNICIVSTRGAKLCKEFKPE